MVWWSFKVTNIASKSSEVKKKLGITVCGGGCVVAWMVKTWRGGSEEDVGVVVVVSGGGGGKRGGR